jgi:uncharacterized membrane protein
MSEHQSSNDRSPEDRIEHRLREIERRLTALETLLASRAATEPPPQRAAPSPPLARPARQTEEPLHRPPEAPVRPSTPYITSPIPKWTLSDLDQLLSGRGLAWIGGLALLFGALFFLGLAFDRGWIGPEARVVIGIVSSVGMIAGGAFFFRRREALFGHVLVSVGLGTLSLSLFAATRLYDIVHPEIGLGAALVATIAAAVIAIRADSQVVAGYGLVTALIAPPLFGAEPTAVTIGFLATALVGTTIVSLYRNWRWLPSIAFILAAPQLADWITSDAPLAPGLAAVAGFWLVNILSSGGEVYRTGRHRLAVSSTTLLVANAAFLVWMGFTLLSGNLDVWRGFFLAIAALAHMAVGGYFLYTKGDRHPFGLLAFGTGVAAAAMAVPVQFGGPVVPIGWAAQATALAWVYALRNHGYSGVVALVLGTLSILHLMVVEYAFGPFTEASYSGTPFWNEAGATLAFILGAMAVAGYLIDSHVTRARLSAVGLSLVIYALLFETSGLMMLGSVAAVFAVASAAHGRWGVPADIAHLPKESVNVERSWAMLIPVVLSVIVLFIRTLQIDLSLEVITNPDRPTVPFTDERALAAGILIIAVLLAGIGFNSRRSERVSRATAVGVAAYGIPFQLEPAWMVVAWSALAALLFGLLYRDRDARGNYAAVAWTLLAAGLIAVLFNVGSPDRLVVDATTSVSSIIFFTETTAALASIVTVVLLGLYLRLFEEYRRSLTAFAAVLIVYLLSIALVDAFQARIDSGIALEALQKQAQVALSILWATLGGAAFITGVVRWRSDVRLAGLFLLALATAKVFLYDLASLDASYRVLSFIGLGILLLISSYVYQRLKPQTKAA